MVASTGVATSAAVARGAGFGPLLVGIERSEQVGGVEARVRVDRGSAVIRHLVVLRWPAAAHAAHSRCGTSPCRVRSPGHARPVQPSCRESSTPAAHPDVPASAGLAQRPPDGGSRPARWGHRLAAQGGGQLRSRGSVAICAATPVALYARRLRLVHRHLLRPGSRDVARSRNRLYCELPSKPAGRRQRPMCADGEPKRLCRRIQPGGTYRLRGDRVERAPRRQ
jgi:hypothetical protein